MSHKRLMGQYMTPEPIAERMCQQVQRVVTDWRVLDPACGDGNLLLSAVRIMQEAGVQNIHTRVAGVDIDPGMAAKARTRLAQVIGCSEGNVRIICGDFLSMFSQTLFASSELQGYDFNTIISNPPYGRLREYRFFEHSDAISCPGTEMIFLVPLAFLDRVADVGGVPLNGRPMGVTTGHTIVRHVSGTPYRMLSVKRLQSNRSSFNVLSGVKLYEIGGGDPPQTNDIVAAKPYSSETPRAGWLPCLRTGDIQPFATRIGRLWVNYGVHLAHPKEIERFRGPRIFVRRVPMWSTRQLGAAYIEDLALCAGDVLIIRHGADDSQLLKGLCVFLNSRAAAETILEQRPSVRYRSSYPKISGKDLNALLEHHVPTEDELRTLAERRRWPRVAGHETGESNRRVR